VKLEGILEAFNLTNHVNAVTRNTTWGTGAYPALRRRPSTRSRLSLSPARCSSAHASRSELMEQRVRSTVLIAMLLTAAVPLSAHVTLQPKTAKTGMQEYSVRVPTEKDAATNVGPDGVPARIRGASLPSAGAGWKYEIERDSSGRISGVTWSGGKIARDEYEQFQFMARARNAGVFKIEAYQTYGENDVVAWVEAEGSKRPAPQVTIEGAGAEGAAGGDPFAGAAATRAGAPATAAVTAGPATWMGGAALAIALAALVMSMRSPRRVH
jgi:uncharacterized protein YcnI